MIQSDYLYSNPSKLRCTRGNSRKPQLAVRFHALAVGLRLFTFLLNISLMNRDCFSGRLPGGKAVSELVQTSYVVA